jgi:hypothetical protein
MFLPNFSKLTNFIKYCTYAIEKVKDVYCTVLYHHHHFMLGQPLPWILLPLPAPHVLTQQDKDRIEALRKRFGLTPVRF